MRTFAFLLLTALSGLSQAGQLAVPLPGGMLAYKQVESVRERRFANLVEQKTDFSCGAASLATILRQAYDLDVDEEFVIKGMLVKADPNLVRTQGFSMLDMKVYLESIGMRARGYRIPPSSLEKLAVPVIVLLDVRGYKHFVVLQRTYKGHMYIGDPVLGHKRYTQEDFLKGWNGIIFAIIGPGYDKANALLRPPEPLTAKDRLNAFYPVKDAELMDFGFIQSDFL
ncbi:C39 family peptidase [Pseudomonas sp. QL9]|uniref:C39 family peptidase n=1 Tax=Pseudomonas knackmussii (strain DSM 6978 / CCUG 54928 / LMG 23759 / B13) TaxID=1301098 RepID=A0A024HIA0_PSEKB|nr:C39 family peptidase [Pseudomonas knackmussii]CDF84232.1 C39 family peptidase [Pseudomonas knackmussii B13]